MSQKRVFYTDPLAAAWMAKHFGMRFWSVDHELQILPIVASDRTGNWYIHADSLHLLDPRDFDLILYPDGAFTRMVGTTVGKEKAANALSGGGRIIQRDGKAFHWPEVEAA